MTEGRARRVRLPLEGADGSRSARLIERTRALSEKTGVPMSVYLRRWMAAGLDAEERRLAGEKGPR